MKNILKVAHILLNISAESIDFMVTCKTMIGLDYFEA